jgi:DNA-binding NarL/FixJ family response regulator
MKTEETTTTATLAHKPGSATPKKTHTAKTATKPATKTASKAVSAKKPNVKLKPYAGKKPARPEADKKEERANTKKATVLELLRRKEGATTAEIAKATKWQNHSIRGFIRNVAKKMGLRVESPKNEAGERTYLIVK